MSVKNFVNYFVEESLKKMSLADLYDSDINLACNKISSEPVDITPKPFLTNEQTFSYSNPASLFVYPSNNDSEKYLNKGEQLIEAFHNISNQAVFEIRGNKKNISCNFYAEKEDIEVINSSVLNFYPNTITDIFNIESYLGNFYVYDFIPDAPFFKALNTYQDFTISPLNMLPKLLLNIEETSIGVYQVIFTPFPSICHKMVSEAIDCEWKALQPTDHQIPPSLQQTAINKRVEYKSHEFRSYYGVCFRLILPNGEFINQVKAFIANYTYGSKPFKLLDKESYSNEQIRNILNKRVSYHTGFIVNSHELVSLLHIPFEILKEKEFDRIFLSAPVGDKPLTMPEYKDIVLGEWVCGSSSKQIRLPIQREIPNVHIIGLPRSGKSTLLNHIAIEKFRNGEAVFVLDHHGDLIETIKKNVPKDLIEKVVVVDFGLTDFTPQITIRGNVDITNPSRVSDDLSHSMRDVTATRDKFWGPRMSYTFSCLYFIYSIFPELDLTHIRLLISPTKKGKAFREKIKARVTHPIISDFLEEVNSTPFESNLPVITRLSQLLLNENSLRLFTIDNNKISISDILETGKLCLINLACGIIGKQRSSILSGLIDSLITNNAFARANIAFDKRKPCTVIKDEFHLGPMDLDNQFTGLPKYNFSIIVAHQYLNQVEQRDIDVLATAGTKIMFKLGQKDAEVMARELNISPYEITSLKRFEAIVRIEDEVVKINTPKPNLKPDDFSEEIMKYSISKYYARNEDNETEKKEEILIDTI